MRYIILFLFSNLCLGQNHYFDSYKSRSSLDIKTISKLAEKAPNDTQAAAFLGRVYFDGVKTKKSLKLAVKFLSMAKYDEDSMFLLAQVYKKGGEGVNADRAVYLKYLKRAASLGPVSQYKYGLALEESINQLQSPNYKEAFKQYSESWEFVPEASFKLAEYYSNGTLGPNTKDTEKAYKYYKYAVDMGNYPPACYKFGKMHIGPGKSEDVAKKYITRAAYYNSWFAQIWLIKNHLRNLDKEEAYFWIKVNQLIFTSKSVGTFFDKSFSGISKSTIEKIDKRVNKHLHLVKDFPLFAPKDPSILLK